MAANAPVTDEVDLGSFGSGYVGCFDLSGFFRGHGIRDAQEQGRRDGGGADEHEFPSA
jgi:hypothetical protein